MLMDGQLVSFPEVAGNSQKKVDSTCIRESWLQSDKKSEDKFSNVFTLK